MANVSSANCNGVLLDFEKSMALKDTAPEVTSGTPPMVVAAPQVTVSWIAVTVAATSAGRAVLPVMKQAL